MGCSLFLLLTEGGATIAFLELVCMSYEERQRNISFRQLERVSGFFRIRLLSTFLCSFYTFLAILSIFYLYKSFYLCLSVLSLCKRQIQSSTETPLLANF